MLSFQIKLSEYVEYYIARNFWIYAYIFSSISIVIKATRAFTYVCLVISNVKPRKSKCTTNSTTSQEFYMLFQWNLFVVCNSLYLTLLKLPKLLCF